jgi:hypothetical protein
MPLRCRSAEEGGDLPLTTEGDFAAVSRCKLYPMALRQLGQPEAVHATEVEAPFAGAEPVAPHACCHGTRLPSATCGPRPSGQDTGMPIAMAISG